MSAPPSPPASSSDLATLRARRAEDYPPDPLPDILPGGGISLIAGASGIGKTAFLAWWTTRFRDEAPIFGIEPAKIPLQAILAIDRSWVQSTSKWFEAAGFPEIPAYCPADDPSISPSRWRNKAHRIALLNEFLDKLAARCPGGVLPPGTIVYVDPLAPFLGGNLLDYDGCTVACLEIRNICRARRITIIGTAHTSKLKSDPKDRYTRLQDRILGSTALLGYTDTQMYLAGPEETENGLYAFFWNPHHAPKALFPLDRDPKTGLFVPAGELPRHEDQQKILAFFDQQPDRRARFVEVLVGTGLAKATAHRHLQILVHDGLLKMIGRGFYEYVKPS